MRREEEMPERREDVGEKTERMNNRVGVQHTSIIKQMRGQQGWELVRMRR